MLRIILVLLLMGGFVTIVIKALLKLSHEDTVFITTERENEFELPTITICPSFSNLSFDAFQNNKTFEDLYEAIEVTKSYYSASVSHKASWAQTNLTNATDLKQRYGVEIKDVWNFSPRMDHAYPFLSVCAAITPPFGKLSASDFVFLMINITNHGGQMYFIEKREKGQSRQNSHFDWGAGIELINPGLYRIRSLNMQSTNRIKSKNHNCDETNRQLCEKSTNLYIMDQLNCKPKWMRYNTNLAECSGKEKFTEYLQLAYNLSVNFVVQNCAIPNCKSLSWGLENDVDIEAFRIPGQTTISYFVPPHKKVIHTVAAGKYCTPMKRFS